MAVFDPRERRICIRIVYDGLAGAGKTTNVRQLASLFAAQRTAEVSSPGEIDGRTLYFDWMQIHGGVACGFPLLCQVISVPGQVVLTERRRHLLSTADVIVYVCDSGAAGTQLAREGLAVVDQVSRSRDDPPALLLQANKQDHPDAIGRELVAEHLDRAGGPCIEAIACEGIGVVDTFIAAVRAATRSLQTQSEHAALRIAVRAAETPEEILARLRDIEIDPEWAAELFLEEAARTFLAATGTVEPVAEDAPGPRVDDATAPFPRADVPAGYVWPAHTGRVRLRALADLGPSVVPLDAAGVASTTVSGFRLTTSRRDHFDDADSARQAIVRAARARTQLGALLSPDTVVVLQPANLGETWLWTITPALPRVRDWIATATGAERRSRIEAFAVAIRDLLGCTARHGLPIDASMDDFGVDGSVVRYLGELGEADGDAVPRTLERVRRELSGRSEDEAVFEQVLGQHLERPATASGVPTTAAGSPA